MTRMIRSQGLTKIIGFLEKFAPRELAESWDNTGLLVEPQTPTNVDTVLLTNDLTEKVVQEAIQLRAQLILSYHPPIFKPALSSITTRTWKERVIGSCIENRIAVYSPHTTWDCVSGGVSDWLLSIFDVNEIERVQNAGRRCTLKEPLKLREIVEKYKLLTKLDHVRLALAQDSSLDADISSIAVCAGSGASVLSEVTNDVDLLVTGEMSHHSLLDAVQQNTSVLLLEHSNSERGFLTNFAEILWKEFPDVSFNVSKVDADPITIV